MVNMTTFPMMIIKILHSLKIKLIILIKLNVQDFYALDFQIYLL